MTLCAEILLPYVLGLYSRRVKRNESLSVSNTISPAMRLRTDCLIGKSESDL